MSPTSRRTALRLGGASLAAALAGCIGNAAPGSDGSDDPSDTDEPPELVNSEVQQAPSVGRIGWDGGETTADLVVIDSRERADAALGSGLSDPARRFVGNTDFGSSTLLLVTAAAPNGCYRELTVNEVALADGAVTADAQAATEGDENTMCTQAITYPSALIRATFDGDPVTEARVAVTDGWGETTELSATAQDPLAPDLESLPGHVRPDGEPETVPAALSCENDDFARHGTGFEEGELSWGEATDDRGEPTFALRVDELAADPGDEVVVTLTNVSEAERHTGNRYKYNLQVRTEAGWQDVRGSPDGSPLEYTDEAVSHAPGEGFEWRLPMSADGVVEGHVNERSLAVCPGLPAGRYRFAFWEPAVAVAFDLR
ncbi:hypothetical protein [Halostella litorea]|uniref:hypothetical protein n=1 Tax=Halostella litorea TaxID=2528831 RepID=UPI0010929A19|nr:hypothetical protein [Halostella litorea]